MAAPVVRVVALTVRGMGKKEIRRIKKKQRTLNRILLLFYFGSVTIYS